MTSYIGKIASNGRFSIVIDHVIKYESGDPFAFSGAVIKNGSASQEIGFIRADIAKISEFLNADGVPA